MSLLVAIQSVIFYYVACTPCNEARARHRAKKQAELDREEKMRIQMEQPGLYRHPSPFHTNPYWQEDIEIGPKPPKNKNASKNASQRGLTSAGTGRNSTSASLTCASTNNDTSTMSPASPTITNITPEDGSLPRLSDDRWNRRRYQRDDEELWGHEFSKIGHKLVDNIVKAGSSAGRIIKGDASKDKEITDEDRTNFYLAPRNPPVNDHHPPIVGSAPSHKDALQWMLQPPPSAKVMEGRIPVSRAQSLGSVASRGSRAKLGAMDDTSLGRVVGGRAIQEKLNRQGTPSEADLIDALIGTRERKSTVSTRGRSASAESSEPSTDSELVERQWKRRPRPAIIDTDDSDLEDMYLPPSGDSYNQASRVAQRPKLNTIRSSRSQNSRKALSTIQSINKQESTTPRPTTPVTQTEAVPPSDSGIVVGKTARDENFTPTPVATVS